MQLYFSQTVFTLFLPERLKLAQKLQKYLHNRSPDVHGELEFSSEKFSSQLFKLLKKKARTFRTYKVSHSRHHRGNKTF